MRNYEIIPHTSDFRFRVIGNDLKELFIASMEGMNSVIKISKIKTIEYDFIENININSNDSSMLLIDFLSELLTLCHTKKAVFDSIDFVNLNETNLVAEIKGNEVDGFDEDIKAVTYTETNIAKNDNGLLEAVIVFDI